MKVGFSTPNAAGSGQVAQSATSIPANPGTGNATDATGRSTSGVSTPSQTIALTGTPTLSGGSAPIRPTASNPLVSGSGIAASSAASGTNVPDLVPPKIASQAAITVPPPAVGQNTVLAALLALKGAHPLPSNQQAGTGTAPAPTLPPSLLSLLKDTVKPNSAIQTIQRSGEVHGGAPRPIVPSPTSLLQRLLDVSSAFKGTLPNPLGSQATMQTPEKLAARLPSASQRGRDTAAGVSLQHHRPDVVTKGDLSIVSARIYSKIIPTHANPGLTAGKLEPDRQAGSAAG